MRPAKPSTLETLKSLPSFTESLEMLVFSRGHQQTRIRPLPTHGAHRPLQERTRKQVPTWSPIHSFAQQLFIKGFGDAVMVNTDTALDLLEHVEGQVRC